MIGDAEINDMQEELDAIKAMEEDLRKRKQDLQELRFKGLRSAMEARRDADKQLADELKALGVRFWSGLAHEW